jgi:hypothetical protein
MLLAASERHPSVHYADAPLIKAAFDADLETFKEIRLRSRDDINMCVRGFTPLMAAIDSRNQALVRYILDSGADINIGCDKNEFTGSFLGRHHTPLGRAIGHNDAPMVALLLTHGAKPTDYHLFHAVSHNMPDVVEALLTSTVDVNYVHDGVSVAARALQTGNRRLIRMVQPSVMLSLPSASFAPMSPVATAQPSMARTAPIPTLRRPSANTRSFEPSFFTGLTTAPPSIAVPTPPMTASMRQQRISALPAFSPTVAPPTITPIVLDEEVTPPLSIAGSLSRTGIVSPPRLNRSQNLSQDRSFGPFPSVTSFSPPLSLSATVPGTDEMYPTLY